MKQHSRLHYFIPQSLVKHDQVKHIYIFFNMVVYGLMQLYVMSHRHPFNRYVMSFKIAFDYKVIKQMPLQLMSDGCV